MEVLILGLPVSILGGLSGVLLREFHSLERYGRPILVIRAVIAGFIGFLIYISVLVVYGIEQLEVEMIGPPGDYAILPFFLLAFLVGLALKMRWVKRRGEGSKNDN